MIYFKIAVKQACATCGPWTKCSSQDKILDPQRNLMI